MFADLNQANAALYAIGASNRKVALIEARLAAEVAKLRKEADKEIAPLAEEISKQLIGIEMYANQHRDQLLVDGKKTVNLSFGNFGWRWTPPRVSAGRGGDAKVLERVKALNLSQYIRTKEELDKEALLRDKPEIAGVKYTQREEFFVDPKPLGDEHAVEVKVSFL